MLSGHANRFRAADYPDIARLLFSGQQSDAAMSNRTMNCPHQGVLDEGVTSAWPLPCTIRNTMNSIDWCLPPSNQ
jgi:hypothetical protein